jgi:hypothetical protein
MKMAVPATGEEIPRGQETMGKGADGVAAPGL